MAIKSTKLADKLALEIDNGDMTNIEKVMAKYSFKDYQSCIRFALSILLLNEDKHVSIKMDGQQQEIIPASDFVIKE